MSALQDRLAGTFRLVSLESRRSDGVVGHPLGEGVDGTFMFDRAGNFAVQLMGTRPMAMFGTYVIDEARRTFTLTPVNALDAAMIGTEVLRHVDPGNGRRCTCSHARPDRRRDAIDRQRSSRWRKIWPPRSVLAGDVVQPFVALGDGDPRARLSGRARRGGLAHGGLRIRRAGTHRRRPPFADAGR